MAQLATVSGAARSQATPTSMFALRVEMDALRALLDLPPSERGFSNPAWVFSSGCFGRCRPTAYYVRENAVRSLLIPLENQ